MSYYCNKCGKEAIINECKSCGSINTTEYDNIGAFLEDVLNSYKPNIDWIISNIESNNKDGELDELLARAKQMNGE